MTNALQREGGKGEAKRQNESKRIQFEFSADALERMERLKEKTQARSYAELIRDALRAYEWMVEEKEAGNEVGDRTSQVADRVHAARHDGRIAPADILARRPRRSHYQVVPECRE